MKASMHCGKGLANHNDRSFLKDVKEKPDHIREGEFSKAKDIGGKREILEHIHEGMSLAEAEQHYYEARFADWLHDQNERNTRSGHPERNKTMEQVYKSSRYSPKEIIMQIGNIEENVDGKQLTQIFNSWKNSMREKYPQFEFLDYARHTDEATPHIHLRGVFVAADGSINQSKALKEMGIERPDPEAPVSRYNNPLQTFTEVMRSSFIAKCRSYNLEIDDEHRVNRPNVAKQQYIAQQLAQKLEQQRSELQKMGKIPTEASVKQGMGDSVKVKGATAEQVEIALSYAKSMESLQKKNKSLQKQNKKLSEKVEALSSEAQHSSVYKALIWQFYEVFKLLADKSRLEVVKQLCEAITRRIEMAMFNPSMMPDPEDLAQQLMQTIEAEPDLAEELQEERQL